MPWLSAFLLFAALAGPGPAPAAGGNVSPDGIWAEIDRTPPGLSPGLEMTDHPLAWRTYLLDQDALAPLLARAPAEFTVTVREVGAIISLPMPDGTYSRFRVWNSPILGPEMAALHPGIETFSARGIDDPAATARLDRTPLGFHALVVSPRGTVVVEPYGRGDTRHYISFDYGDLGLPPEALRCGVTGLERAAAPPRPGVAPAVASGSNLSTYRMRIVLTGEVMDQYGDDIVPAAADVVTAVNMINAIFEREVDVRFNLLTVTGYLDAGADPFDDPDAMDSAFLDDVEDAFGDLFDSDEYDIGHCFHYGSFGGIARVASACGDHKARGGSSGTSAAGWASTAYHEIGHQMGADHTFSGTTGSCGNPGQRECDTAIEPGAGNTIMSYSGLCGAENIGGRILFFHTKSYDQIQGHRDGDGACADVTATGNSPPTVDAGADYTIPRATPFTLTASGNDPDGDALTYSWEQFDVAPACELPPYDAVGPLFRSRAPTTSPSRTFPPLADILAGVPTLGETLPTADRDLNFRCTARDSRAGGGGVNYDGMVVHVAGDPFFVTYPNGGEQLTAGCPVTVTWTVGGGNVTANVNILYSTNGGSSFSTLLAATPNDGSQSVTLPCTVTSQARIRVEGAGNIFFDVSDANVRVTNEAPSVAVNAAGGEVDANCELLVTFGGTVTDDCAVSAADVSVAVTLLTANATLGAPVVVKNQVDVRTVSVSGSVLVSDLTGSPATIRVAITGTDNCGRVTSNSTTTNVSDNTPPVIVVSVFPEVLWPANHTLRDIAATVTVTDNCPNPSFQLISITSNEPDNGLGDGDTPGDIQGASYGSDDTDFQLRAERMGGGSGRVYTITYRAFDQSGNSADAVVVVRVPKSQGASALAASGWEEEGGGFAPNATLFALVVPSVARVVDEGGEVGDLELGGTGPGANQLLLNARAIEIATAYVGSGAGVVPAVKVARGDVTGDGLTDLVCFYEVGAVLSLQQASTAEDGPIGLHFNTFGADYLVADIFALGIPIRLPELPVVTVSGTNRGTGPLAGGRTPLAGAASPGAQSPAAGLGSPAATELTAVFPNPFQDGATVGFSLAREEVVDLAVYDVRGARVRTLERGRVGAGRYQVRWDGRDDAGRRLSGGIFFVRLDAGRLVQTRKTILMP